MQTCTCRKLRERAAAHPPLSVVASKSDWGHGQSFCSSACIPINTGENMDFGNTSECEKRLTHSITAVRMSDSQVFLCPFMPFALVAHSGSTVSEASTGHAAGYKYLVLVVSVLPLRCNTEGHTAPLLKYSIHDVWAVCWAGCIQAIYERVHAESRELKRTY